MNLLSYGDSIPYGDYRLHSVFERAVNFSKGPLVVSLVTPGSGAGPLNLVLRRLPTAAGKLRATRSAFYLDARRLPKARAAKYNSSVPQACVSPALVRRNVRALKAFLSTGSPQKSMCFIFSSRPPGPRRGFESKMRLSMEKAVGMLRAGEYGRGAEKLRGLGYGLTPSGDDFLSGMLVGLNFSGGSLGRDTKMAARRLYANSRGANPISNSSLRCSYRGLITKKIKRLMRAVCAADRRELLRAAAGALKSGHTSGADFCAGLVFSLSEAVAGGNTPAAPARGRITGENK